MRSNEQAIDIVRTLTQYLTRKAEVGALFDARLEGLLSMVDAALLDPYSQETLERFKANPQGLVENEMLQLQLVSKMDSDPDLARQLSASLEGGEFSTMKSGGRRKWLIAAGSAGLAAAVAVGVGYAVGGSGTPDSIPAPAQATVTSTVEVTTTPPTATTSSTTASSTTATSSPASSSSLVPSQPAVPGDGSVLDKGIPVLLTDLPRPTGQWVFYHGDHDVQLTQYTNSVWTYLSTCESRNYSGEQQFRLKNFSRVEVQAVGTDGTADPSLAVKFEIFVNNDTIHPIAAQVMNPGEAKPLGADLPANVFAVTIRASLVTIDKSKCRTGNAVWGSPYVVASGR